MSTILPSRKLVLGVSAVLLALSFFFYSSSVLAPRYQEPPPFQQGMHIHHQNGVERVGQVQNMVQSEGAKPAVVIAKPGPRVDVIDNGGAIRYLQEYSKKFNPAGTNTAIPNDKSTIKQWWEAAAMIDWYINSPLRYRCKNRVPMGNWHVCQDEPFLVKKPCLVYSFGINFDFSFDDAMGKLGCEVHSFDPSMNMTDHQRSANVTFHNLGLGATNTDAFNPRKDEYVVRDSAQKWGMKMLKTIVKMLKHENRVIDVLKIDIEGYEWHVLENLMETEMFQFVRQFMLEFHLFPDWPAKQDYMHLYHVYSRLREMGFREYKIGPHPKTLDSTKFNNQGDSEYVNYFFKKQPHWT